MKSPKKPEKYEVPSWDDIYDMCLKVADQIKNSGYKMDLIVAVSRGGWIPGRVLSDILENPKIATIKVEYYEDIYKTRDKPEITQPLTVDVSGKKILLVDDIADSGHSLELVRKHLFEKDAADVKICALYRKPWSIVAPDFNARTTDAWVCFPHEIFETMRKVYSKSKKQGKTKKEIEQKLLHMGIKSLLVRKFLSKTQSAKN
jgi:hypoxanthine phosphoribosyltransferase